MSDSSRPVCLITGVGPGTGTSLVKRFTRAGYHVAMVARSGDRLQILERQMASAKAFVCDIADADQLDTTLETIKSEMGAPNVVIHNAVGGAFGDFLTIEPSQLAANFQINTMALLHIARATVPDMVEAGHGALIATGNTSAYRGKANFAAFAPTKAAQRILLESIGRQVGPSGIHVAYCAIDAVIDVPWTREMAPDRSDDFFAKPDEIAESVYQLAHQPRSTWTSDLVIRPFGEAW